MIIELTDMTNAPVFINSEHIIWINTIGNNTNIAVTGGKYWNVQETPSQISAIINGSLIKSNF
ncbi:hypothetical protein FJP64_14470 [Kosakonia cowanii]|jgi:hypothetical protein|uniref:flagellar FlbD family protein n=1 Tax=Kosakonia cowanii TaxID=208223 RepID=UPI00111E84D2|nr:flagellar FlbD family protein [Kosakonia cowanii]TPD64105.1 hypothetical protein FJP70_12970 [Kosakonia cowanii]TPD88437.1 hypothetical protein FJP67_12980 [Kosakonia cowanii]TPE04474.1 hypothetical protein FJP64_14470 [Kosakonia cowanii]